MKRVAVLGCGPAGLLAAHACRLMGHQPTVFSNRRKSPMLGAQYLHKYINGFPLSRPSKLSYVLQGTVEGYRDKIYGDVEALDDITVSPELFVGYHEAWSLRQTYDWLWAGWHDLIVDCKVDQDRLQEFCGAFDNVISTIPAPALCYQKDKHQFQGVKVWIDGYWFGDVRPLSTTKNLVVCNGFPYNESNPGATGWYRTSTIFGQSNTEWSPRVGKPSNAHLVVKPIRTDCDCWPGIVRAGRYGQWQKGVLSHEAFELVLEVLA